MKKIFSFATFIFLFGVLFFAFKPSFSYATEVGPHIVNYDQYEPVQGVIRGTGSSVATVYITLDCVIDSNCINGRVAAVKNSGITSPIFRVGARGGQDERAMTTDEAGQVGRAMEGAISNVFPGALVEFGNEVNNINFGWSGGTPASYSEALRAFIQNAGNLRVLPAALDPYFTGQYSADEFIRQVVANGGYGNIAGLSFHAYHNSAFGWDASCNANASLNEVRETKCSWLAIRNVYASNGVTKDLTVMTEYSLHPSLAGDISDVRDFIDSTKNMWDGDLDYLTPLILNSCRGQGDPPDNWEWLLFDEGSPSRIIHPGDGRDMTSSSCDVSEIGPLECKPLSEVSGGGDTGGFLAKLASYIGSLASLFQPAPPPVNTTDAECAVASKLVADSLDRPQGQPICPADPADYKYETTLTGLKAEHTVTFLETLVGLVDHKFDKNDIKAGSDIGDYGVSDQTIEAPKKVDSTSRKWLNGTYLKTQIEKRIDYANDENTDKDPKEFLKDAGVKQKLSTPKCFSKLTSSWKRCEDVQRDEVLVRIMRNYACELLGRLCDSERGMDVIAGYLHTIDGTDSPGAVTWVSAKCPSEICRPMWASEFVCMNGNWAIPGALNREEIAYMCNIIMGPLHNSGMLVGDSIIGSQSEYDLRSCAEDCKYGPGKAWWYIPNTPTHEISAEVCETINNREDDPSQENVRCKPIGIPGITASLEGTKNVSNMINALSVQAERQPYQLPEEQCVAAKVSGIVYDYLSNAHLERQDDAFHAQWNIGGQAQGAATGDVLQAADPPANPPPVPPAPSPEMDSHNFVRGEEVKFRMTEDIPLLVTQTEEIADAMLPVSVGESFEVEIGGVPIKARGTGLQLECGDGDFQCESKDVGLPAAGGPLDMALRPGHSVLSDALLPYDPNKTTTMSRFIKKLADRGQKNQPLAKSPWQRLASLFVPDKNEVAVK